MKREYGFAWLALSMLLLMLSGCHAKTGDDTQAEIVFQETSTAASQKERVLTGEVLLDATSELSDVRNDMGGEKITGQSEIIRITKSDFEKVTDQQFADYAARHEDAVYDWYAIVFDDETAILFFNDQTTALYGEWDEESGITKLLGTYEKSESGIFSYKSTE